MDEALGFCCRNSEEVVGSFDLRGFEDDILGLHEEPGLTTGGFEHFFVTLGQMFFFGRGLVMLECFICPAALQTRVVHLGRALPTLLGKLRFEVRLVTDQLSTSLSSAQKLAG